MLRYHDLPELCRQRDEILFSSIGLVQANYGAEVDACAEEILGYLSHRGLADPMESYLQCHADLLALSGQFDRTGRYPARRYSEVVALDRELYNLRLLMSYVTTNHRFELLKCLIDFLRCPVAADRDILSIGVGTGYEVKLMREHLPQADAWRISACDNSDEALAYARDLLTYFGLPTDCLWAQTFPLETAQGIAPYAGRFGKIVLCEVLEHLEDPDQALDNVKIALHPQGHLFLTMAINLPQEDHIYLYESVEQARAQVRRHGFRIEQELATPATVFPFADAERERLRAGNYICVVTK
jgi:2-polyprenyl-3-methyl-5-hydroxy-6-metoxy-1,4-benzoquinol methylase